MPRLRDLGVTPGRLPAGHHNAVTDVPGVRVGHTTLISGDGPLKPGQGPVRTGVTAILPHGGNLFMQKVIAATRTLNGFGKACGLEQVRELGVLETPILLTNTLNVGRVADAVVAYMLRDNPAIGITTGTVNPVVGECNDGYLNDIQGRHVRQEHVWQAIETAASGPVAEGSVGAGTGTICYGFKGGIGTASRQTPEGYTVGALVQANFGGRADLLVLGVPVGRLWREANPPSPGPGSVMIILATDAPLTARQVGRLAQRAAFGLARTGTFCSNGSGDFALAFSTANPRTHHATAPTVSADSLPDENSRALDGLFLGVVEAVEEAVLNALVAAETMVGRDNHHAPGLPPDWLTAHLTSSHRLSGA
ncbi:MAG: P1 family peptidase [Anaerolineae bacterium]|nr:P1 family peptidase [Anaerolineae bacterium]